MIKLSLIAKTDTNPSQLTTHAAKTCYTSQVPKMGPVMDVENNLFKTGHHTTIQHNYFTFNISELSISSVTFGLHLTHSFYNADQRSGRYSKMYAKPNLDEIKNYLLYFWKDCDVNLIASFVQKGWELYNNNLPRATEISARFIREERPNATEEYITANAEKIAQEQLRTFISTSTPTALDYTANLSTILAMYRASWSPEMREITRQMKELILNEYEDLAYMFDESTVRKTNWTPEFNSSVSIKHEPQLHKSGIIRCGAQSNLTNVNEDSVDLRYFTPENMSNDIIFVQSDVEVSVATFAQDQRHRTIKRSEPKITGNFYLPPIVTELHLEDEAQKYMQEYIQLAKNHDKNLMLTIIPYGAMVRYTKVGDLNAVLHEQEKRLCWSAQEEIYNLSRQLHDALVQSHANDLAETMCPACYKGHCIEGRRYCGRNLLTPKNDKITMPKRKV